jgi:hypothetical protein
MRTPYSTSFRLAVALVLWNPDSFEPLERRPSDG